MAEARPNPGLLTTGALDALELPAAAFDALQAPLGGGFASPFDPLKPAALDPLQRVVVLEGGCRLGFAVFACVAAGVERKQYDRAREREGGLHRARSLHPNLIPGEPSRADGEYKRSVEIRLAFGARIAQTDEMSSSSPRPPAIECRAPGGFGAFTVRERFPQVIERVRAGSRLPITVDARLDELLADVVQGRAIRAEHFRGGSAFWRSYVESREGRSWAELAFFETEFCFYHAINSLVGAFDSGVDVFATTKREALEQALAELERDGVATRRSLRELVMGATLGNLMDLSQLTLGVGADEAPSLLLDHSLDLCNALAAPAAFIHVILDNVGAELCADLLLVDHLLATRAAQVVLHAKPWPMFVSDALVGDVSLTLERFCSARKSARLRNIGSRLHAARDEGRLLLETHPAWGEARHFSDMPGELVSRLRSATVVVAKGDLNYRRFLEDRAWAPEAPLSLANSSAFSAYGLRVLKSEALAGVPAETIRAVERADPEYRINGRYAMIQWLPAAAG